jgi:hypothetical protein
MEHDMGAMAAPSGTFLGHLLPGLAFLALGMVWLVEVVRSRGVRSAGQPLESGTLTPWAKILTLFVGGWVEMPNSGWYPADYVMGWHHITIYMGFALSGVVDLLHRRGGLSARATYLAFGGACLNGAFLFFGHGNHGGVESTAHLLLATQFAACGALAAAEGLWPGRDLHWFRTGSMLILGGWFVSIAWLLFRSGWDLADPVRVGWVYPMFSWVVLGVAAVLVVLSVRRPTPR